MQVAIDMTFKPGMTYTLTTPAYNGASTNAWLHVTAGTVTEAAGRATHQQAAACAQAAFSGAPQATHSFEWTAPAESDCVTVSAAQASGSTDAYNIGTVRPEASFLLLCQS